MVPAVALPCPRTKAVVASWVVLVLAAAVGAAGVPVNVGLASGAAPSVLKETVTAALPLNVEPDAAPAPPLLKVTLLVVFRVSLSRLSLPWQKVLAVLPNVPVVRTPLVVVMTGRFAVLPIAPALVMLP